MKSLSLHFLQQEMVFVLIPSLSLIVYERKKKKDAANKGRKNPLPCPGLIVRAEYPGWTGRDDTGDSSLNRR